MPPRYVPHPYRVTLDLDPVTSDALTKAAQAAGSTRHRLAYEFVQRGLGVGLTTPPASSAPEPEPDTIAQALRRGLDDLSRLGPRRT